MEELHIFLGQYKETCHSILQSTVYCLMPNHFHFMVHTAEDFDMAKFQNNFRIMISSYTRAINKQENRTGSLFQQNSKAKSLTSEDGSTKRAIICFNYIHQNPLKAQLVKKMEDWEYSSFKEYIGRSEESLCDRAFCLELLSLPSNQKELYDYSYELIQENEISEIF